MEEQQNVQDNNLKKINQDEFILIISGRKSQYIYPLYTHQQVNEQEGIRLAKERGETYHILPITIPEAAWTNFWIRNTVARAGNQGVDISRPIINEILGDIYLTPDRLRSAIIGNRNPQPDVELLKSVLIPRNVNLTYCYFYGNLYFKNVESEYDITFDHCKFFPPQHSNSNFSSFVIEKCKFKTLNFNGIKEENYDVDGYLNELKISELIVENITIQNYRITSLIIDSTLSDIKNISIINCAIREIKIIGQNIQEITIRNIIDNNLISMKDYNTLFIDNSDIVQSKIKPSIYNLSLDINPKLKESKSVVKNGLIDNINITGVINGEALFMDCTIRECQIRNLANLGDLRFHNILNINQLILENVSLGKAEFMNVSINNAQYVQVIRSSLYEIILNNTSFPKNLVALSKTDYAGIREVFRQLKLASGKQGDIINELKYKTMEMNIYRKDSTIDKSFVDKFILYTNEYSNNHGTDWRRAFLWHLGISVSFFILIKLLIGYSFVFRIGLPDFESIAEYFNFSFNPLHDFDKVFKHDKNNDIGLPKFLDAMGKILAGYLLYQYLQAFRKFSK